MIPSAYSTLQDLITFNECTNSGDRIFLYRSAEVFGVWVAYGLSAFILHRALSAKMLARECFSEEMQMPVVAVREPFLNGLSTEFDLSEPDDRRRIYHICSPFDEVGKSYSAWARSLRG